MIAVTGATGHVGTLVAEELSRRGVPFRMIVRDEARAPDLPGGDVVVADFADQGALGRVLAPGDRVFMVSVHAELTGNEPRTIEQVIEDHREAMPLGRRER